MSTVYVLGVECEDGTFFVDFEDEADVTNFLMDAIGNVGQIYMSYYEYELEPFREISK